MSIITITLTADQERSFTRCADAARVPLDRWIVECAAVHAANVIDVLQADARRKRAEVRADNATATAARARLPRKPRAKAAPEQSATLKAAREYNAQFRSKPVAP